MNLQLFRSFLSVAKCRNFTQAAQSLNFTQPAISAHIAALEKLYHVTLLRRDGKNIYLTNAGQALVRHAENLLREYEDSLRSMEDFQQHQATLRIAVSTQFINYFLMDVLSKLHQEFQDLSIEVHRCMTVDAALKETFTERIYDLALVHLDAQPLYTKRKVLGAQNIVWVVSRSLFRQHNCNENIYDYPLISYPKGGAYFTALKNKIDFSRFRVETIYSDSESVKLAALRGLGAALLPEVKIRAELDAGEFILMAPEYQFKLTISLLYRQDIEWTPVMQRFIELLDENKRENILKNIKNLF